MKINKLRLLNFRCFEEYELNLSDRLTLLIGDNGKGKTALLDAIAYSINNFLEGFSGYVNKENWPFHPQEDDVKYTEIELGQTPLRERIGSMKIQAHSKIDKKEIDWSTSRYIPDLMISNDDLMQIRRITAEWHNRIIEKELTLPILSFYRTGRLWNIEHNENEFDTLPPGSRLAGYRDCLSPASDLEQLFRWFKTQEIIALQKQEKRHTLEAVRNAIVEMIPEAKRVWWNFEWDQIFIETTIQDKTQHTPFHLLSDGYRNMIGMVADIAYRMATLNPQLEADVIKQTEGIVLIDEIDLHLHPKWQREVVGRLLNTFPKVQFVASSHSPFIIQSLYGREDCLLWDLEKAAPLTIESKSIEDIAENQQGVEIPQQSQRFLDMEKAAIEYYEVLQGLRGASDEEKQRLKQKLDDLLEPYSDNPAFQAFLKMERQAAEGNTNAS